MRGTCRSCSVTYVLSSREFKACPGEFFDVVRARLSAAWLKADKDDKALFRTAIPSADTGHS